MKRRPGTFGRDERGATLVEFGLVAPVLCIMLLGAFDYTYTLYMQAMLQGTVQKAARDSSLETGTAVATQTAIDTKVSTQVKRLHKLATVNFSRRYYRTFSKAAAAQHESFTDSGSPSPFQDGKCNNGEPYVDANNNNRFDRDGGDAGQGGARDKVIYTVTMSYPRVFPLDSFVGGSGTTTLTAATVLSNQPYGDQDSYGTPTARNCGAGTVGADAP